MSNKFVYKNLISVTGSNPSLYKDDKAVYALVNNSANGSVWIDIHISYDDGETWFVESYFPPDTLKLYDAKMVTIGENKYVFAHGINQYGIDTIRYIKYELYLDSDEIYSWDDEWHDLFSNYLLHARVTDVIVDSSQSYIHLTYDKATADGTYGVYYAIYSPVSHQIVFNSAINSSPNRNQHNAKLIQSGNNTFGICWEEENVYKKNQIKFCSFDSLSNAFYNVSDLSIKDVNDKYKNHYHPSMVVDSCSNIHITWLTTDDSYDTNSIQYTYIKNNVISDIQTLSQISENNKYPFIMCDESDNLYILYNYTNQNEGKALQTNNFLELNVRYLVKKYDSSEWNQISDLTKNNWNILCGWCSNKNIYSLIIENDELYFLRIDTDIAEIFAPVSDLKIDNITNSSISLSWTKARNAEKIYLQRLDDDKYIDATLVEPLSATDTWAKVVNLEPGNYKFRIKYVTSNNVENVVYLPQIFSISEDEFKVSWNAIDDIISQTLQYTKETWSNLDLDIKSTDESLTYSFSKHITQYRLNIVGGVAEGYSNTVKPLNIELFNEDGVKLTWSTLDNINFLAVQESIDRINWYKAKTKEVIKLNSDSCIIENLNNVIYHYRLIYRNSLNTTVTSNVVSIVNNLKLVDVSYNSVVLNWNDIDSDEGKYFQYSIDHGITWDNVLYPINNNLTSIPNLKHNTEYLFRIYFPNRYSGIYSNVVTTTTNKKPINDLILVDQTNTSASLKFTTDDDYSDVNINLYNAVDDIISYKLSELEHTKDDIIVNNTFVGYEINFTIYNLRKGDYYNITVEPLDSDRGDESNVVNVQTQGDGIENLECENVDAHSITLRFPSLDRIDENNISKYVSIFYSYDDVNYSSIQVTSMNVFKLENLMQNTNYHIYMKCYYGDNYGQSSKIEASTSAGMFEPLYGQRLPGERCFCKAGDAFYVFDKGILYKITESSQEIVYDYKIKANHIYASMDIDQNNALHIVFSYGKELYYATNCVLNDNSISDIKEPTLIFQNSYANEIMFPDIKITYDNKALIVYEENFGYRSSIEYCAYKNKIKITDSTIAVDDNTLNVCPKIALKNSHSENKGMNGFFVITIDNDNTLKLITFNDDNDKSSSTYKDKVMTVEKFELHDNFIGTYNEINIESDNLDKPHFCYYSYNNNSRSMTYAVIEDGEISQVSFNRCQFAKIVPRESLIAIIEQDNKLYSSKFSPAQSTFTDRMLLSDKTLEIDNFVDVIHDNENIYVLSFENGEFLIQTFKISDIEENNNYIDNNWIANEFSIDDEECNISVWTDGDINNYPLVYVKINNLVSDITPRDSFGNILEKSITINSLANANSIDQYVYELTYNKDKKITIDANIRLVYDWDNSTIINENK